MEGITDFAKKYWLILGVLLALALIAAMTGGDVGQLQSRVNDGFGGIVSVLAAVLFFDPVTTIGSIFGPEGAEPPSFMPLVVMVLLGGAIFFTLRFAFINLRGLKHSLEIVGGTYDDPDAAGEVSSFQALSSALSATVGLGNIAGVAIAVSVGGPGAVFWMVCAAFFGMASKFAECTLGQMYRQVDADGEVRGGPMVYLRDGLAEIGWPKVGRVLSVVFAVLCIGGSFGGGNMFQANQSFMAMAELVPALGGERAGGVVRLRAEEPRDFDMRRHMVQFIAPGAEAAEEGGPASPDRVYIPETDLEVSAADWKQEGGGYFIDVDAVAKQSGIELNAPIGAVSAVKIAKITGRSVEWTQLDDIEATNIERLRGGAAHLGWLYGLILAVLVGIVIVGGIKRIGSVADKIVPFMCVFYVLAGLAILIIHASDVPGAAMHIINEAFAPEAIYGGFIGVFIQGIRRAAFSNEAGIGSSAIAHSAAKTKYPIQEGLVAMLEPCIDTILICSMTGIVIVVTGVYADPATAALEGVELTAAAFGESLDVWAKYLLSGAVVLFAFSTMISWSYYGERCWTFLFGNDQSTVYRVIFCFFVWVGCVSSLQNVLDFSDLMILSMAFPNIVGVVILSGKVKRALDDYWSKYRNDELVRYK